MQNGIHHTHKVRPLPLFRKCEMVEWGAERHESRQVWHKGDA